MLVSLMFAAVACRQSPQMEPWFIHARRYIEADALMLQTATEATFSQNYDLRAKAESLLAKDTAPSISTLGALLRSADDLDRKVALVTIMATRNSASELFTAILERYQVKDDFFTKFYSQRCFQNLSDSQIATFQDKLVSIFTSENNEVVIASGMTTLIRLDRAKVKQLLISYLKTGTLGLRRIANLYVNKMGDGFYAEVEAALENDKAVGALKFLQKTN